MKPTKIKQFATERGIKKSNLVELKGSGSKEDIRKAIVKSIEHGATAIWANAHGLPNYICLEGGMAPKLGEADEDSCDGFRYDEFAEILLERGELGEVILIIDSCFSYNFAEKLIESLREKNSVTFPTIITAANKEQLTYIGAFLNSLDSLDIKPKKPLLGKHIYKAEEFSYAYQDSAVFFSENGVSLPLEIAMNSLNPTDCGCTGDSCPIEPTQGETS